MDKRYIEKNKNEVDFYVLGIIGITNGWNEDTDNTGGKLLSDFIYCESRYDKINIYINSVGGYVYEALPFINMIKASKKKIITINFGLAASMGAQILMAGHEIYVAENSVTLFHSPSGFAWGNASEMQQAIENLNAIEEGFVVDISSKTGKTKEEIKSMLYDYKDHSFSAEKMKEIGFINDLHNSKAVFPKGVEAKLKDFDKNYNSIIEAYRVAYSDEIPDILTNTKNEMDQKKLALSLGLAEDATEEQINLKIEELKKNQQDSAATQNVVVTSKEDEEKESEKVDVEAIAAKTAEIVLAKLNGTDSTGTQQPKDNPTIGINQPLTESAKLEKEVEESLDKIEF